MYSNPALDLDVDDRVRIASGENQRSILYGDIIFTGSSETPDECGMSSVVTKQVDEPLYLNSFCFIFRFNNPHIMLPDFAKHLFRSNNLRHQISKTASGVTRYNVSKKKMERVMVPVPPLEIQQEIVGILDKFSDLTANLTTELAARRSQYEYYRDRLLTVDTFESSDEIQYMELKNCVGLVRNIKWKERVNEECLYIDLTSVDRDTHSVVEAIDSVSAPSRAQQIVQTHDVLLGTTRPMLRRYCYITDEYDGEICSTGFCVLRPDTSIILPKWLYHNISSNVFFSHVEKLQKGASYPSISDADVKSICSPSSTTRGARTDCEYSRPVRGSL